MRGYCYVVWWVRIGKWHAFHHAPYGAGSHRDSSVHTVPGQGVRHATLREAKAACLANARHIRDVLAARDAAAERER